jgi:hypothetical protein
MGQGARLSGVPHDGDMTVDPDFEYRLAEIEDAVAAIQAAVTQVRTDLDGYAHIPIDPMTAVIDKVRTKMGEADLGIVLPWFTAEVRRLAALRNEPQT